MAMVNGIYDSKRSKQVYCGEGVIVEVVAPCTYHASMTYTYTTSRTAIRIEGVGEAGIRHTFVGLNSMYCVEHVASKLHDILGDAVRIAASKS